MLTQCTLPFLQGLGFDVWHHLKIAKESASWSQPRHFTCSCRHHLFSKNENSFQLVPFSPKIHSHLLCLVLAQVDGSHNATKRPASSLYSASCPPLTNPTTAVYIWQQCTFEYIWSWNNSKLYWKFEEYKVKRKSERTVLCCPLGLLMIYIWRIYMKKKQKFNIIYEKYMSMSSNQPYLSSNLP